MRLDWRGNMYLYRERDLHAVDGAGPVECLSHWCGVRHERHLLSQRTDKVIGHERLLANVLAARKWTHLWFGRRPRTCLSEWARH